MALSSLEGKRGFVCLFIFVEFLLLDWRSPFQIGYRLSELDCQISLKKTILLQESVICLIFISCMTFWSVVVSISFNPYYVLYLLISVEFPFFFY